MLTLTQIVLALLLLACHAARAASAAAAKKPNILFVLVDDQGTGDTEWVDPVMRTPNMQKVKEEGRNLVNAYGIASCTPSRTALMTSKLPYHYGLQVNAVDNNNLNWVPETEKMLPQALRELGYSTHMIGKWHLGFCDWDLTPLGRGFDTFYGKLKGNSDFYNHGKANPPFQLGYYDFFDQTRNATEADGQYSTTLFNERAKAIIRNQTGDVPFFIFLSHQAAHSPLQVPARFENETCGHIKEEPRRKFCGMIACIDEGLGEIMDVLKEKDLYDNTIIVMTSDNGANTKNGASSNWPYRGKKATLFEGGNRVPTVIRAPAITTDLGADFTGLFQVTDWYPTLVEAAGGTPPSGVDGISQYQELVSNGESKRKTMIYNIRENDGNRAIRNDQYKLFYIKKGNVGWYPPQNIQDADPTAQWVEAGTEFEEWALYDLINDPGERTNIYSANKDLPEVVEMMEILENATRDDWRPKQNGGLSPEANAMKKQLEHWIPGWCDVDPLPGVCNPSPCLNNGTCFQVGTSYRCECPRRASGTNCEVVQDCKVIGTHSSPMKNIKSHESTEEGELVVPLFPNQTFMVMFTTYYSMKARMESARLVLRGGNAKRVVLQLYDDSTKILNASLSLSPVLKDYEVDVPYLLEGQSGNKIKVQVLPEKGTTDIQLLVRPFQLCALPPPTECGEGWHTLNNTCYKFFDTKKPYAKASKLCKKEMRIAKSKLVNVESQEVNDFLMDTVAKGEKQYWLGASDLKQEGSWKWDGGPRMWKDGAAVKGIYTNWGNKEPKGDDWKPEADCLLMKYKSKAKTLQWRSFPCQKRKPFICQYGLRTEDEEETSTLINTPNSGQ